MSQGSLGEKRKLRAGVYTEKDRQFKMRLAAKQSLGSPETLALPCSALCLSEETVPKGRLIRREASSWGEGGQGAGP